MIMVSMSTHTPVTDYLGMTLVQFLRIAKAAIRVIEKKNRTE